MWSTNDVLEILRNYRRTHAKIEILEGALRQQDISLTAQTIITQACSQFSLYRSHVESWLKLLPREERFLIQTHLIDGLDWAKTIAEYEKEWGVINGRSERTLKRIQAKAIKRIVECMNEIEALTGPDPEKKNSDANEACSLTSE